MKKKILLVLGVVGLMLTGGTTTANVVLTTPEAVKAELGGPGTIDYDQIRTVSVRVIPATNTVILELEIFASSDSAQPAYDGTYRIDANDSKATLEISRIGFERGVTLNPGQVAAVAADIAEHVANVENSMTQFGMVVGTQQP